MAAACSRLAGCLVRTMVAPVLSLLVSVCTVPATYSLEGYPGGIRPVRGSGQAGPPDRIVLTYGLV